MRVATSCLLIALTVPHLVFAEHEALTVLTSLVEVVNTCQQKRDNIPFDITATVAAPGWPHLTPFLATDGDCCQIFGVNPAIAEQCPTNVGDIVRIMGRTTLLRSGSVEADSTNIVILGHGPAPQGILIRPADLLDDKNLHRLIRIEGVVRSIYRDEIDPRYLILQLNTSTETVFASVGISGSDPADLEKLSGAKVSVLGNIFCPETGHRRAFGRIVSACARTGIRILEPASLDDTELPDLTYAVFKKPTDLLLLPRHRVSGLVIAVFNQNAFLLQSQQGDIHRITIAHGSLPRFGQRVMASGFPSTDFYRLNLDAASWRLLSDEQTVPAPPKDIAAETLYTGPYGLSCLNPSYYGKAVRIRGIVRGHSESGRVYLDCKGQLVIVDISSTDGLGDEFPDGATVDASGTCVMETVDWDPFSGFPQTKNMLIVARTADDVRIVAYPSWWTTARLLTALATLALMLVVILVWNRILQRLVNRRSDQLIRARLAEERSAARSRERTRLAVELHDALSQNLTGVTFQLDASLKARPTHPDAADHHLQAALRALNSCRTELGRCLWDLRSEALDLDDFGDAIHKVVQPIANGASVSVRFLIPRQRLSDTTAHAVLRIIRELVANSVRHGHATHVRIAGDISTGALKFSVADNGRGFDPQSSPGPREGHFGLAGIKERVKGLKGNVIISSTPGKGTKTSIEIPTPLNDTPDEDSPDEED